MDSSDPNPLSFLAHLQSIENASHCHGRIYNSDSISRQDGRADFCPSVWRDKEDNGKILNSFPGNIVDGSMPCPSTPLFHNNWIRPPGSGVSFQPYTPNISEINKTARNASEKSSSIGLENHASWTPLDIGNCSGKIMDDSTPLDSTPPHFVEGAAGSREGHGIDLNKTPKPKQRRKKHRPKVIVEGKKTRTPKPRTPKPVTPKPAVGSENPSGKRKYVRRNLKPKPPDAPPDSVQVTTGMKKMPVKRKLNLDCDQDSNEGTITSSTVTNNGDAFVGGATTSPGNDSTVGIEERPEIVVDNSRASFMFDLNMTATNQESNEYISFSQEPSQYPQTRSNAERSGVVINYGRNPEISTPSAGRISTSATAPQPSRREAIIGNVNDVLRNNGIVSPLLDDVSSSKRNHSPTDVASTFKYTEAMNVQNLAKMLISENRGYGDPSRRVLLRENVMNLIGMRSSSLTLPGLGVSHSNTIMTSSNRDHGSASSAYTSAQSRSLDLLNQMRRSSERNFPGHDPYFSDLCKKSRIEREIPHDAIGSLEGSSSAILAHFMRNNTQQAVSSYSKALALKISAHENIHSLRGVSLFGQSTKLACNQSAELLRKSLVRETLNVMEIAMPEITCREMNTSCSQTASGSANHIQENRTQLLLSRGESIVSNSCGDCMTNPDRKKRKERNNATKPSPKTTRGRKPSKKDSVYLHIDCIRDSHSSSAINEPRNGKSIRASRLCKFSIEEITHFLSQLNINKEHSDLLPEEQNALALYNEGLNIMVPYADRSDIIKKRRMRVKVDLDPESQRMWRLLMENGTPDPDDEATSKEKEKYWEEERRVFQGRADSFIARMHLVQGDRRFSPWKGSVVDSVVGVFLTQNVSDHLSSSAFMALAARFPFRSGDKKEPEVDKCEPSLHHQEGSNLTSVDSTLHGKKPHDQVSKEAVFVDEVSIEGVALPQDNVGGEKPHTKSSENGDQDSSGSRIDTPCTVTGSASYSEADDRRSFEDAISSQGSAISPQNSTEHQVQTAYQDGSSFDISFEKGCMMESIFGELDNGMSFTQLLHKADGGLSWEESTNGIDQPAFADGRETVGSTKLSHVLQNNLCDVQESSLPFTYYRYNSSPFEMQYADGVQNEEKSYFLSRADAFETPKVKSSVQAHGVPVQSMVDAAGQPYSSPCSTNTPVSESSTTVRNQDVNLSSLSHSESSPGKDSSMFNSISTEKIEHLTSNGILQSESQSHQVRQENSYKENTYHAVEAEAQVPRYEIPQSEIAHGNLKQPSRVVEFATKPDTKNFQSTGTEAERKTSKMKNAKPKTKNDNEDWDKLRRNVLSGHAVKERDVNTMDSLDWEAVKKADVNEIANTIKERGMNYMLSGRIKDFLDRMVRDHGSIDLEWLRDVEPSKVKEYLLSIRGLGLKSVECVRLLTLRHLAFPVDTNVGRICVRLGWVPLQPLPESLQLHLLEMYPVQETIQKYLWPRLCKLDQKTLYELHYQMITFGKVFCTKSKPNCNACPMRGECKHFASALASTRFALPPTEERNIVASSSSPSTSHGSNNVVPNLNPLAQIDGGSISMEEGIPPTNCESIIKVVEEPIIEEPVVEDPITVDPMTEEPATPEEPQEKCTEFSIHDIEDAFWNVDYDEIPTITLNIEALNQNVQSYMQANNMEPQGEASKALVLISEEAASIPMPKLKNVSRLRTEHQVYQLPDSHPLLEGLDSREPDDPCPYLLAIWTPDETAQSTERARNCCNSEAGRPCHQQTCMSCNSKTEAESQIIKGTLLIPCRTAMRGSFPLNGTYFQVNEVFADHDSSHNPINVPRNWLWNLPRRTVYFGTSIPSIFRGLTTEGIQHCFWRGLVCVRGFHRGSRAPRPLYPGLHFPASKTIRNKRASKEVGGGPEKDRS